MAEVSQTTLAPVTAGSLAADLRSLGVSAGRSILLHASLRSLGRVEGGAPAVIEACLDVLGPSGTLVVPAMTMENSDTSREFERRVRGLNRLQRYRYRRAMPAFDPQATSAAAMGVIAERVRTAPGAVRSIHPQASFAAIGAKANDFMNRHSPECHFGRESPLGALYDDDAMIVLLGVGYDVCTAFHLAEYLYTENPPRRQYACVIDRAGRPRWWRYEDVVLDDSYFSQIGSDLDETNHTVKKIIGTAPLTMVPMRVAVDFATSWLGEHRSSP